MSYSESDFVPRARGRGVFCSAACGFNCTRNAYDRAVKEADRLAKRLGDGWTTRVWDNLGWHYEVSKGMMCVSPRLHYPQNNTRDGTWKIDGYAANFRGTKQFIGEAETPEDAIGYAIQDARTHVARLTQELAALA